MPKGGFLSRRGWQNGALPPQKRRSKKAGPPASAKEVQRRAEFRNAVRAYEWEAALTLAATDQEKTDVAESKNRVDWFEYFLAQGDKTQAMLYAITNEERQRAELGGAHSDETKLANDVLTKVLGEASLLGSSRRSRPSILSRIGSTIGSAMSRKSSKGDEASPKASGGEVTLQTGRV